MREHIHACRACARELRRLEQVMLDVEAISPVEPPAGLWSGVYARISETAPIVRGLETAPIVRGLETAPIVPGLQPRTGFSGFATRMRRTPHRILSLSKDRIPRRALSLGTAVAAAALAAIVIFSGPGPRQPAARLVLEPAAMEYVRGHLAAASQDAFADRVGIGFAAALPAAGERELP